MEIDLTKYITDQALILIPVLYVIGMIIKKSAIKDNYIPFILLAMGIGFSLAIVGPVSGIVQAVIQGILVTGATVGINQGIKQIAELKPTGDTTKFKE